MPLLGLDDQQDQDDQSVDILGEVSLKSFKATPTNIGPFGASVLSWSVAGPAGFHVELNNANVAKIGQRVVQPTSTASYRLSAHSRQASKTLGTVHVIVDRASCETYDLANPRSAIEAPVRQAIKNMEGLSFKDPFPLIVAFSPGRIHIRLHLEKEVNNFPNASVTINTSFGLFVHDGTLEPFGEQISIDISFPWYAWLVPGAALLLPIAIDMAKESARKDIHDMVVGIGQLLNFLASAPLGKRMSTVRVDAGNNGAGVIELTACTQDLLLKFADLSASVILG
jgi:hypothetical protein